MPKNKNKLEIKKPIKQVEKITVSNPLKLFVDFLKTGINFKTAVGPPIEAICEIKIASVVNNLVSPI